VGKQTARPCADNRMPPPPSPVPCGGKQRTGCQRDAEAPPLATRIGRAFAEGTAPATVPVDPHPLRRRQSAPIEAAIATAQLRLHPNKTELPLHAGPRSDHGATGFGGCTTRRCGGQPAPVSPSPLERRGGRPRHRRPHMLREIPATHSGGGAAGCGGG
jgi:hypothetical protein